ncbi:MAG: zinc-binding alcohol dehydrogenase family protein [Rhizobiaceae bacterium]
MEALVCLEPGKLNVTELAAPRAGLGMALVRPRRVGICGTDYHIFEGKHPFLEYPRVMGHELAVEVVESPADAKLAPGDICVVNPYLSCGHCVACRAGKPNCCTNISVLGVHQDGGMAGLLALPPGNLIPAGGLTTDECATVEFLAIGAHAVRRGGIANGDRALVVGAGPIGLGVAIFARLAGASVTVLDVDPERVAVARSIAKVETVAAGSDASQAVDLTTDGEGFDVVFDATGNQKAMMAGFEYVAHGGRYVLVSVVKDAITFADPDFHRKEMTLLGSRNATSEDFERVIAAIEAGEVPVDRLITHRTSLRDAVRDIPVWATQKNGLIKALIEID